MEKDNYRVVKESQNPMQQTAFRVSGVLHSDWIAGDNLEPATDYFRDTILVDATRCQNGEELATIIGQAINENPGKSALKALGGTFMPSMGTSIRQDRYGWIELTYVNYNHSDSALNEASITNLGDNTAATTFNNGTGYILARSQSSHTQAQLEQIPASGWIRVQT